MSKITISPNSDSQRIWELGHLLSDDSQPDFSIPISVSMDKVSRSHINIIGGSGMGKSSLSDLMIRQLWTLPMSEKLPGGLLIDPHGDLATSLMLFARENVGKLHPDFELVHLSPGSPFSFRYDPFHPSAYEHVPEHDRDDWRASRAQWLTRAAIRTEKTDSEDMMAKILEWLPFFFQVIATPLDDSGEHLPMRLVSALAERSHPQHKALWKVVLPHLRTRLKTKANEFLSFSPREYQDATKTTRRRLERITDGIIAPIFDSHGVSLDIRDAITSGKWVLLDLQKQSPFESHHANYVGSVMLSAFADTLLTLPEQSRRPFFFWVDEALRFTGKDTIAIIKEARKYKATGVFCLQDLAGLDVGTTDVARQLLNNAKTSFVFNLVAEEDLAAVRSLVTLPNLSFKKHRTLKNINFNEYVEEMVQDEICRFEHSEHTLNEATSASSVEQLDSQEHSHVQSQIHETGFQTTSERVKELLQQQKHSTVQSVLSENEAAIKNSRLQASDRKNTSADERTFSQDKARQTRQLNSEELKQTLRKAKSHQRDQALRVNQTHSASRRELVGIESSSDHERSVSQRRSNEEKATKTYQSTHQDRLTREQILAAPQEQSIVLHDSTHNDVSTDATVRDQSQAMKFGKRNHRTTDRTNQDRTDQIQETSSLASSTDDISDLQAATFQFTTEDVHTLGEQKTHSLRTEESQITQHARQLDQTIRQKHSDQELNENTDSQALKFAEREIHSQSLRHEQRDSVTDRHTISRRSEESIRQVDGVEYKKTTGGILRNQRTPIVRTIVEEHGLEDSINDQYAKGDQEVRMLDTAQMFVTQQSGPSLPVQVHELKPAYAGFLPAVRQQIAKKLKATFTRLPYIFLRSEAPSEDEQLQHWLNINANDTKDFGFGE